MEKYLQAGKIINTHGVGGRVKLEHWCDSPEVLAGLDTLYFKRGDGFFPRAVTSASVMKGRFVLAKLEGIDTLEEAAKLKNTIVYADRDDLPLEEGAHFISDLIGLDVFDVDTGDRLGTLVDVQQSAASQLYEIDTGRGMALVPVVSEFVKRVDPPTGIYIKPIEGLLDP
jgi:16S rRNA processing protein RimM